MFYRLPEATAESRVGFKLTSTPHPCDSDASNDNPSIQKKILRTFPDWLLPNSRDDSRRKLPQCQHVRILRRRQPPLLDFVTGRHYVAGLTSS